MEAVTAAVPPQLPARLLRFFAKYPPQLYSAKYTGQTIPLTKKDAKLLRITEAEQKEQARALAEVRAEEKRLRLEGAKKTLQVKTADLARTRSSQHEVDWNRIKAINAGQIKAPKVKPVIPMTVIMSPQYISLPRLEKLRMQQIRHERRIARPLSAARRSGLEDRTSIPMPAVMSPKYPSAQELRSLSSQAPTRRFPPNPFLPKRRNKRWLGAAVSLRRQADLVKLARKHNVETLLPASRKSTEFKQQRLLRHGLRVRGTGEGQKVKGHKWERNYEAKMQERYKAIQNMPALIRDWEARGHGRGLKRDQYPRVKMP